MTDCYNPGDWWNCCNLELAIWLTPVCPCCGKEYPDIDKWLNN